MSDASHNGRTTVLTWAVCLMASVVVAGVPWAFLVQSDVAKVSVSIESLNKNFDRMENPPRWFIDYVKGVDDRVRKLEENGRKSP